MVAKTFISPKNSVLKKKDFLGELSNYSQIISNDTKVLLYT